jgi:sugar phosphate isomerase/epimerase
VTGLVEPNPDRAAALDTFRKRCEMWAELGIPIIYSTTITSIKPAPDDYKTAADRVREVGEIAAQFKLTALFEFTRNSTFASTLPTMLAITRASGLTNVGPLFDCYHFWSGYNKLTDMDQLRPGEIKHVHFQDVQDMPRELLDMTTRVPPGDGVTPLVAILQKLAEKGYAGPLSIELLAPKYSAGDPFEVAREVKAKGEAVMKAAGVL